MAAGIEGGGGSGLPSKQKLTTPRGVVRTPVPGEAVSAAQTERRARTPLVLSRRIITSDTFTPAGKTTFADELDAARGLEPVKVSLWNLFAANLPEIGVRIHEGDTIVDVGCGDGYAARVLNAYFGGGDSVSEKGTVNILGVDADELAIKQASERYHGRPDLYEFHEGNATDLASIVGSQRKVGAVVVRHPDWFSDEAAWKEVYEQSLSLLEPDGVLIVTGYTNQDKERTLEALNNLHSEVIVDKANPNPTHYISDHYYDNNIVIARKKREE